MKSSFIHLIVHHFLVGPFELGPVLAGALGMWAPLKAQNYRKQASSMLLTKQNSVQHLQATLNNGHLSSPYYVLGVVRDDKYTFLSSRASKGR